MGGVRVSFDEALAAIGLKEKAAIPAATQAFALLTVLVSFSLSQKVFFGSASFGIFSGKDVFFQIVY